MFINASNVTKSYSTDVVVTEVLRDLNMALEN